MDGLTSRARFRANTTCTTLFPNRTSSIPPRSIPLWTQLGFSALHVIDAADLTAGSSISSSGSDEVKLTGEQPAGNGFKRTRSCLLVECVGTNTPQGTNENAPVA